MRGMEEPLMPVELPAALPVERIESAAALEAAAERWRGAPALALDTEFVRERTFYQRLGLIQVSDGKTAALIDPQAVPDLAPFLAVLGDCCEGLPGLPEEFLRS